MKKSNNPTLFCVVVATIGFLTPCKALEEVDLRRHELSDRTTYALHKVTGTKDTIIWKMNWGKSEQGSPYGRLLCYSIIGDDMTALVDWERDDYSLIKTSGTNIVKSIWFYSRTLASAMENYCDFKMKGMILRANPCVPNSRENLEVVLADDTIFDKGGHSSMIDRIVAVYHGEKVVRYRRENGLTKSNTVDFVMVEVDASSPQVQPNTSNTQNTTQMPDLNSPNSVDVNASPHVASEPERKRDASGVLFVVCILGLVVIGMLVKKGRRKN